MKSQPDIVEGFSVGGQGVEVIIIVGGAVGRLISGGGFWLPKTSLEEEGAPCSSWSRSDDQRESSFLQKRLKIMWPDFF